MIDQDERVKELMTLIETTPYEDLEAAVAKLPGGADGALALMFALLASEFNPKKAKGKKGVFQFEIPSSAGDNYEYFVHVANDACTTGPGRADGPDITIGVKLPDMLLMGTGKLPGAQAFMTGKLKIRGNPLFGTKLGDWFDHPPA